MITWFISEVVLKITDQDENLVNFKGELVTIRLHLKRPIWRNMVFRDNIPLSMTFKQNHFTKSSGIKKEVVRSTKRYSQWTSINKFWTSLGFIRKTTSKGKNTRRRRNKSLQFKEFSPSFLTPTTVNFETNSSQLVDISEKFNDDYLDQYEPLRKEWTTPDGRL